MKLIDKAQIVAEIEKCYNECLKRAKVIDSDYWSIKADAYRNVLVVLYGTLEVKKVNLEKKINKYISDNFFGSETIGFFANRTKEEPNDQEVIEKATELRDRIESLEKSATKVEIKKDDNLVKEIKRIRRKIRNLKKKLIAQPENPVVKTEIEELEILVEKMKIEREVK